MGIDPRVVKEGLMPKGTDQGGSMSGGSGAGPGMADQYRNDMAEIERLKLYKRALKDEEPPAPPPDKIGANVDKLAEAFSGIYQTSLKQITDLLMTFISSNQQRGSDPALQVLMQKIGEMQSQQNPQTFMRQYKGMITELKDDLGLSHIPTAGTPQELQLTVQLEMMKMEAAEKQHRWEEERDERKHQWEKENKQWDQDFLLKKEELKASGDKQSDVVGTLKTLALSLVDSIDMRTGGAAAAPAPSPTPYAAQDPNVIQWNCNQCGTLISIPRGTPEARCPKCNLLYRDDTVAPAPAPQPAPLQREEPVQDGSAGQPQGA